MGCLSITVTASGRHPVIALSGEADVTTVTELATVLATQADLGARHLTVDLSGLLFADCTSVRALLSAGRVMRARGGSLRLVNPQGAVAKCLSLLGATRAGSPTPLFP
jgi:anti-sigma B factor antagonist